MLALHPSFFYCTWASLVAQMVKDLPATQETLVQSLGREDSWRRKWLLTPVILPGEFHGPRSLASCSWRGQKESDMTELLSFSPCCCCCCEVASVVSDSVRPHRRQPIRLPRPWDSPGKNTGVGCHFPLQCMKVKSESEVAQSCLTLVTPWTAAYQAPPSMGFSRPKYWSGVPLPSPHYHLTLCYITCLLRSLLSCLSPPTGI